MKSNHKQTYQKFEPIINTAGKKRHVWRNSFGPNHPNMTDNSLAPPFALQHKGQLFNLPF